MARTFNEYYLENGKSHKKSFQVQNVCNNMVYKKVYVDKVARIDGLAANSKRR